jgi:putative acetyltransferase
MGLCMRIRLSNAGDGSRVMDIWRRSVDATHDFLAREDRMAIEAELLEFLPNAPLLLAVDSDDVAHGFMFVEGKNMHALFVDPARRGMGIGKMLVLHALSLSGEICADVNEQNAQAVGFYEHLGFLPVGRSDHDGQGRPYPLIHLRLVPFA